MLPISQDQQAAFMRQALHEAQDAFLDDEIPVGAVVVCEGKIIGRGHNLVERLHDCTAHAEMIALTAAMNHLGAKYLPECALFVTLEPCLMCAGALRWSQIGAIYSGAADEKNGFQRFAPNALHPKTQWVSGLLAEDGASLMKDFFKNKRKLNVK